MLLLPLNSLYKQESGLDKQEFADYIERMQWHKLIEKNEFVQIQQLLRRFHTVYQSAINKHISRMRIPFLLNAVDAVRIFIQLNRFFAVLSIKLLFETSIAPFA